MTDEKVKHHATLSPSSMPARAQCAHFKSSDSGDRTDAEIGKKEHQYIEKFMNGDFVLPRLAPDSMKNVAFAIDYLQDMTIGLERRDFDVEKKLKLKDDEGKEISFGTVDFIAYPYQKIIDYKSGRIKDYSAQMKFYALMAMETFGWEHCDYEIIYGAAKHVQKSVRVDRKEAQEFFQEMKTRIENAESFPPQINEYCKFCEGLGTCAATVGQLTLAAAKIADGVPEIFQHIGKPVSWNPAELSERGDIDGLVALGIINKLLMEKWSAAVNDAIKKNIKKIAGANSEYPFRMQSRKLPQRLQGCASEALCELGIGKEDVWESIDEICDLKAVLALYRRFRAKLGAVADVSDADADALTILEEKNIIETGGEGEPYAVFVSPVKKKTKKKKIEKDDFDSMIEEKDKE